MILQLATATVMVLLTVMMHGLGLALLGHAMQSEVKQEQEHHVPSLSMRTLGFTMALVLALSGLHGLEIWTYAFLYDALGAVVDLETAIYFSTISYAGIGFDDRYIEPAWRLVSAIEGINGLLLLGWSTAFFVTVVTRLGRRRHISRHPSQAHLVQRRAEAARLPNQAPVQQPHIHHPAP
jgi:Ion channel